MTTCHHDIRTCKYDFTTCQPKCETKPPKAASGNKGFKKAVTIINLKVSLYLESTVFNPKNNEFLIPHFTKHQPLGTAAAQILSGGTL